MGTPPEGGVKGMRYSISSLVKQAFKGHGGWPESWRHPARKKRYDAIIVGGGGHGLATAYYLAKNHGINNVAVLERGWIGSGNVGRNRCDHSAGITSTALVAFLREYVQPLGGT
mgnify:CR=1 FL=1